MHVTPVRGTSNVRPWNPVVTAIAGLPPFPRHRTRTPRRKAGESRIRYRRPADRRSRPQQWNDAVQTLLELQEQYREWRDALPQSRARSATAELLEQVCDLHVSVLEAVELPRNFGRDASAPAKIIVVDRPK